MRTQGFMIAALLFALLTAIFAVVNVEPVKVNFIFTSAQLPLILVILGSTLLGGLIVGLFGIFRQFKLQRELSTYKKQHSSSSADAAGVPFIASSGSDKSSNHPSAKSKNTSDHNDNDVSSSSNAGDSSGGGDGGGGGGD